MLRYQLDLCLRHKYIRNNKMVMYEVFNMIPDQILNPLLWLHYGHFVSLLLNKWILLFPLFSGKLWFVWSDIWHNVWNVPWGNCGNKEYHRQDSPTSLLRQELPEGANYSGFRLLGKVFLCLQPFCFACFQRRTELYRWFCEIVNWK